MKYPSALMFVILSLLMFCLIGFPHFCHGSESRLLVGWSFSQGHQSAGWTVNGDITEIQVEDGFWSCRTTGSDPIVELQSSLEITASSRQMIEVRMKADHNGMAEFFWSNTHQGPYGGFSGSKRTPFQVSGDGQWRLYRLFPFWQTEGKIIRLRFDLFAASRFSLDRIRILELPSAPAATKTEFDFTEGLENWLASGSLAVSPVPDGLKMTTGAADDLLLSPPLEVAAVEKAYVSVRLRAAQGKTARLIFTTDKTPGMQSRTFPIKADGKEHIYHLDMLTTPGWKDQIVAVGLQPSDVPGALAVLRSLAIAEEPQGPPQLHIQAFGLDEAAPRAGIPAQMAAWISNAGGEAALTTRFQLVLPNGLRVTSSPSAEAVPSKLGVSEEIALRWTVECTEPVTGWAQLIVSAENAESVTHQAALSFGPRPQVEKASYVPKPEPVRGPYDVGVYYFPGWQSRSQWQPIERYMERKPVLGWYREGDPEVADWHIKWAVEHGITFFAYDWYWSQGARQLEHGLHEGYFKARYRHLLKFCLLWANHNPPKTHSLEDCLAVTRHWITHYFQRPEYYRIDGRPVIILFSPGNFKDDLGSPGVNQALEAMRAECRKAGLPGLYILACVGQAQQVKGESYDAVTAYNWPGLGMTGSEQQAPYASLIPAYHQQWTQLLREDSTPVMLPISGGWDSRPWHGDAALVRFDRTPALFKQHLQDARKFLQTNSTNTRVLPAVLIEAWNEWGEGSYIEPHREFGFGYLDAVRDVYADAPAGHTDLAPIDVGLGPYELTGDFSNKTQWNFETNSPDWKNTMHLDQVQVESGKLKALSVGHDPAFSGPPMQAKAGEFSHVNMRLRLTSNSGVEYRDSAQLFWSTRRWPESEASSVRYPVLVDGQWHDYRVAVKDNPRWTGIITRLRLDPVNRSGIVVEIQDIALEPNNVPATSGSKETASLELTGDWQLQVSVPASRIGSNLTATVSVSPPATVVVNSERYDRLPLFNSNSWGGWVKGAPLCGVLAQECTTPGLLDPGSLTLRSGTSPNSILFVLGQDYAADLTWATVGRLPEGRIAQDQPVFASYRHGLLRIDSLVFTSEGRLVIRQGEPRPAAPRPPQIETNDVLLANIWLPGAIPKLTSDHLFPVLETAYPAPPKTTSTQAELLLPKTLAKLRQGRPLRILAWGDSVTDGSYLPKGPQDRWQEQFAARLQKRFLTARIELLTEAWGGRNTGSYLQEPPGSPHSYQERVLGLRPDLIVSEFVNDAGLTPEQVEQRYAQLLTDFQAIQAEWIILTPHYVRPDWMGLTKERDCDQDPRPYVLGLRQFAARHSVALADASLRFGRLWRQGLPYNSLMLNSINHPDERGMKLFADSLMELFP